MKHRYVLLLLIAAVYLTGYFTLDRWKSDLYNGDANGYYLHVVSFFVNQDVGSYDKTITRLLEINPGLTDPRSGEFGVRLTEKGRRYIKYPLGVPVMEAPFFLAAHAYTKLAGSYEADGWSLPYLFTVSLSIAFYVLIGFYLLMLVLERYFSKRITVLVVAAIAFATNLFYFSVYLTMAHGFLFFDYCLLIYLTVKFYDASNLRKALAIGAMCGLIALTRIPEAISILIPLLWGITGWQGLKNRISFFVKNYSFPVLAVGGFVAVFSIQVIYWYYVSGHFFFNPYAGEGFDFLHPHILNGWFHFSNGWLIYTPIMAFAVAGCFLLRRYFPAPQLAALGFVAVHAYIHYSYYAWTYPPGLGSRPMVETYPILSFGLASSFAYCTERKYLSWVPAMTILFFSWLNIFQTWQIRQGIILPERGNAAFYCKTFGTMTSSIESLRAFDTGEFQPDINNLGFIKTLASEGFEDSGRFSISTDIKYSGQSSLYDLREFIDIVEEMNPHEAEPGDWMLVGINSFMKENERTWDREKCEHLVLQITDEKGRLKKWKGIKISSQIGNNDYSIWNPGGVNQWGEAAFFVRIPRNVNPNWKLKVFINNPRGQKLYLDDFFLKLYKNK